MEGRSRDEDGMVIGSGLIARAFDPHTEALSGACIYAAGVSNSSCQDAREFERERQRLAAALASASSGGLFLYFSTCSIDTRPCETAYAVQGRDGKSGEAARAPSCRAPAASSRFDAKPAYAAESPYARIVRSERFAVWGATCNIIDVDDAARIVTDLVVAEK
jgi:hypothetical protein